MKTTKGQQFEIVFYAFLAAVVGVSIGYFIAASQAAALVRANAADGVAEPVSTRSARAVAEVVGNVATVTVRRGTADVETFTATLDVRGHTDTAADADGNEIGGGVLNLVELMTEHAEHGLRSEAR